jgi:hypothetical protein
MKILVVTFEWADNYGALLQAFALQDFLEKKDHEVYFLESEPKSFPEKWLSKSIKSFCVKFKHNTCIKPTFSQFRKEKLKIISLKTYQKYYKSEIEVYLVGSDQVWSQNYFHKSNKSKEIYLLKFAPNNKLKSSYASSLGGSTLSDYSFRGRRY